MAISIFMGITDPDIGNGDSKDTNATFKLLSLSYSAVAPVNSSGISEGKPSMSAITVTLNASYAPDILSSLLGGKAHTVTITIEKPNAKNLNAEYEQITLNNAILTLFQETASSSDTSAVLELSFAYRRFTLFEVAPADSTVTYTPNQLD